MPTRLCEGPEPLLSCCTLASRHDKMPPSQPLTYPDLIQALLPSPNYLIRMLIILIRLANPPLDRWTLRNPIDPLQQMRESLQLLLGEAAKAPSFHPRPGANVRDRVFSLAGPGEVFARGARVFTRQADFEYAVDAEGFISESLDGV